MCLPRYSIILKVAQFLFRLFLKYNVITKKTITFSGFTTVKNVRWTMFVFFLGFFNRFLKMYQTIFNMRFQQTNFSTKECTYYREIKIKTF